MLCITEAKETKIDGEYYRACDTFLHLGVPFLIYLHLTLLCVCLYVLHISLYQVSRPLLWRLNFSSGVFPFLLIILRGFCTLIRVQFNWLDMIWTAENWPRVGVKLAKGLIQQNVWRKVVTVLHLPHRSRHNNRGCFSPAVTVTLVRVKAKLIVAVYIDEIKTWFRAPKTSGLTDVSSITHPRQHSD